jgi:hypothetical protein
MKDILVPCTSNKLDDGSKQQEIAIEEQAKCLPAGAQEPTEHFEPLQVRQFALGLKS